MASRSYSIDELLDLRAQAATDVSGQLIAASQNKSELGEPAAHDLEPSATGNSQQAAAEIVRHLGNDYTESKPTERSQRTKDDSSTDSDELLFKGNKKKADRRVAESNISEKATEAATEAATETVTGNIIDSSTGKVADNFADSSIKTAAEDAHPWVYHGRSASEAPSISPVVAPTGTSAQKDEGFQRFYKAVASPTHVRVTAGGRIVPNTRGPVGAAAAAPKSPQGKAGKESFAASENQKPAGRPVVPPILIPPVYPGFPGMPLSSPVPLMPMMGMSGPFPFAPSPSHPSNEQTKLRAAKSAEAFKLSSPEHFDQTRPFFFNGHYYLPYPPPFPPPMGSPFVPFPMAGNQPFSPASPHGPLFPSTSSGVLPMPIPGNFMPMPPMFAGGPAIGPGVGAGVPYQPPSAPPPSSIKSSEITKKHIEHVRLSLKYIEDQLAYNKHQIDEKKMAAAATDHRGHIRLLEQRLAEQLRNEEPNRAKTTKNEKKDAADTQVAGSAAVKQARSAVTQQAGGQAGGAVPSPSSLTRTLSTSMVTTATPSPIVPKPIPKNRDTYNVAAMNTTFGRGGLVSYDFSTPEPDIDYWNEPIKKAGLSVDAAKAPPFQPRGSGTSGYRTAGEEVSWDDTEQLKGSELRRKAAGLQTQGVSESLEYSSAKAPGMLRYGTTAAEHRACSSESPYTFSSPYYTEVSKTEDYEDSYDGNLGLGRKLTQDEQKARALYFGNEPGGARRVQTLSGIDLPAEMLAKHDFSSFSPMGAFFPKQNPLSGSNAPAAKPKDTGHALKEHGNVSHRNSAPEEESFATNWQPIGDEHHTIRRQTSFSSQQRSSSADFNQALEATIAAEEPSLPPPMSSQADTKSSDAQDRPSEKTSGMKLWQDRFKKGNTSSAISSTTAHGFLPQYNGAVASLSPSLKQPPFLARESPSKEYLDNLDDGGALVMPTLEKRGENLPPSEDPSLEHQQRRSLTREDDSHHHNISSAFKF